MFDRWSLAMRWNSVSRSIVIGAVLASLVGGTALIYATGGTEARFHALAHVYYLPIVVAAFLFGPVAGILTAVAATVLGGPLMPENVALGVMQPAADWLIRAFFFVVIGGTVGVLTGRLRTTLDDLHESQRSIRTLLSNLPGMAYRCHNDRDWTMEFASEGCFDLTGYRASDLVGNANVSYNELIHPDDRQEVWEEVQAGIRERSPFQLEYRIVTATGEQKWVWEQGQGVSADSSDVIYLEGYINDITERKQAEKALQQQAARLVTLHEIDRAILEARSPAEIAQAALRHIRGLTPCWRASVVEFAKNGEDAYILAVDVDSETRVQAGQRVPLETFGDVQALHQGNAQIVEDTTGQDPLPDLLQALHLEGCRSYVNIPLAADGELIGTLNMADEKRDAFDEERVQIVRQVADQVAIALQQARMREQIQHHADDLEHRVAERAADLQAANEELDDFAYVVSHDLKAPLRGITQLAGWLSSDYAAALDPEGQELLDLLAQRAQRMHNLIDGILEYSRARRNRVTRNRVDLDRLVREVIDMLSPPEDVSIVIENELPDVVGDPIRLTQVFQNLLDNAVKYAGKPRGRIEVNGQDQGDHWLFSVADNGPGIEEKYHAKVFQMFETLAPRDEIESTGVGLAVTEKIVETWGGRIWLESTVGKGSTFLFTLPKGGDKGAK